MPKGPPGGNPNIRNIGKETRYKKNDPRAAENGRKGRSIQKTVLRPLREIVEENLNADEQKYLKAIGGRLLKMCIEDGNLAAIQYVVKLIGQDPGDLLTVSAPQLSEDAKKAIDQLLKETRGEVR